VLQLPFFFFSFSLFRFSQKGIKPENQQNEKYRENNKNRQFPQYTWIN